MMWCKAQSRQQASESDERSEESVASDVIDAHVASDVSVASDVRSDQVRHKENWCLQEIAHIIISHSPHHQCFCCYC